jgi:hypothetical protein
MSHRPALTVQARSHPSLPPERDRNSRRKPKATTHFGRSTEFKDLGALTEVGISAAHIAKNPARRPLALNPAGLYWQAPLSVQTTPHGQPVPPGAHLVSTAQLAQLPLLHVQLCPVFETCVPVRYVLQLLTL